MASREDIADFLLQKGYLLTALEFYQELLEDDGTELESLKEYFIKQQPNFETESPRYKNKRTTPEVDPPLFHHHGTSNTNVNHDLLEKLKEKDDKVSLLEYELRRAREDITNLRTQLTNIVKKPPLPTDSSSSSLSLTSEREGDDLMLQRFQRERIREHEAKVLNYLIKNYLVQNKYSLTAITFSEEMAEDLTTWESVGLETPEPPPLLSLYRYFFNDNGEAGIQGALAKSISETSKLKKELAEKDAEFRVTKKKMLQYQKDNEQLQTKIKELGTTIEELKTAAPTVSSGDKTHQASQGSDATSHTRPIDSTSPNGLTKTSQPKINADSCPMRAAYKNIVRKRLFSTAALSSSREIDAPDETSARIAQEISKIGALEGDQQVVRVVADCLPHIVPGVLLSKREELIPVILIAISQHPSDTERFALTKLLFNLIKKPNDVQRQVIMNACIALASIIGPQRTETELLAQCLDQIGDKHAERRVLVADACGQLAPYVPPEQKYSLILSIMQQMIEDKSALVRLAVVRNIAVLISSFDSDEKYVQIAELFVRLLSDADPSVSAAAKSKLLPAMIHWSDLIDAFHSKFLNMLLSELQSTITKNEGDRPVAEQDIKPLIDPLLSCFLLVIPRMKEEIFASNPTISAKDAATYESQAATANLISSATSSFTRVGRSNSLPTSPTPSITGSPETSDATTGNFISATSSSSLKNSGQSLQNSGGMGGVVEPDLRILGEKVVTKLKTLFDMFISTQPEGAINTKDWPMLDWMINEFLPRILQIITAVPANHHSVISSLVEVVSAICRNFGIPFTKKVMKNLFLTEMRDSSNEVNSKRLLLLPVYLSGVLTSLDEAEIIKYLHELIVNISIEENGWGHHHLPVLKEIVGQLCVQSNFKSYVILDTLCDMVAHPSNQVRLCIVTLFNVVIPSAKIPELEGKILNALITLSNDPDTYVRTECIEPLANIVVNCSSDEALDKLTGTFDMMMESDVHQNQMAVVQGLTNIIPHLTFKRQFRDFYILPLLVEQAQRNSTNKNVDNRKRMASALFEAFRAFASASLSKEVIEDQVLPGLKLLVAETGGIQVETSFRLMVQSMMQDMRNNIGAAAKDTSTPTPKSTGFSNSTGNLGQLTPSTNVNPNINTSNTTTTPSNNSNTTNSSNTTSGNTPANNPNAEKGSATKKNLFEKLDTSSISSITSSLKADFDKAIPKWTWKNNK
eukprot:Phypoly_transcript_00957.p1 GENE.Phypoly_transcript_00957~~Phypoly_transcript_00957.p1  ORF type:complete len:1206 (+),score=208.49 Phypoly_transcript_00957:89-3706(+)